MCVRYAIIDGDHDRQHRCRPNAAVCESVMACVSVDSHRPDETVKTVLLVPRSNHELD